MSSQVVRWDASHESTAPVGHVVPAGTHLHLCPLPTHPPGAVLDTADPASRAAFLQSHSKLVEGVVALAKRVQADRQLANLIRRKFAIKCTTGYSLNALVRRQRAGSGAATQPHAPPSHCALPLSLTSHPCRPPCAPPARWTSTPTTRLR